VRSSLLKAVAAALVVAAVLVPGAFASDPASVKLNLLPLQKAQLGSEAVNLHISRPSGGKPNYGSRALEGLGRLGGYQLTYGSFFLADPVGLSYVQTGVDEYRTPGNAKRALPYWKKRTLREIEDLTQLNMTATVAPLAISGIAHPHWARIQTFSVTNYGTQYLVTAEFSDGNYVLDVGVQAGSQDLATSYAVSTAKKLDDRLHLWLSGHLQASPVTLPPFPHEGPPASGPDPSTMLLHVDDLGPNAQLSSEGYDFFPASLSTYSASFDLGGPTGYFGYSYNYVYQVVSLMPSTNSAAFAAAYQAAESIYYTLDGNESYAYTQVTPVDLSAVGDEAQGEIVTISSDGYTRSQAVVTLHSGAVADVVYERGNTPILASDVQTLAQAAADRLDAALGP
jgi:hypothetical protein